MTWQTIGTAIRADESEEIEIRIGAGVPPGDRRLGWVARGEDLLRPARGRRGSAVATSGIAMRATDGSCGGERARR